MRPKVPFGFMAGYFNAPQKTVEAWRNLCFHTGDADTMRADGLVTYVDRIKDCIRHPRRRGRDHAGPGGAGCGDHPADIVRLATQRLPRFAAPRFVKVVPSLPKTATGKVQRAVLRKQGIVDAIDVVELDVVAVSSR